MVAENCGHNKHLMATADDEVCEHNFCMLYS